MAALRRTTRGVSRSPTGTEHHWWFSADDAPETWHVSADIDDDSGPRRSHVGDMDITLVDAYETRDPFALLDGQDAELGHVAGTLFDAGDGRLDPDLDEQLEPLGSRILILHSVSLAPEWRGFGLGALLAGTAIMKLSGGARAAVCYPAPLNEQTDAGPDGQGDAERDKAVAALRRGLGKARIRAFPRWRPRPRPQPGHPR